MSGSMDGVVVSQLEKYFVPTVQNLKCRVLRGCHYEAIAHTVAAPGFAQVIQPRRK